MTTDSKLGPDQFIVGTDIYCPSDFFFGPSWSVTPSSRSPNVTQRFSCSKVFLHDFFRSRIIAHLQKCCFSRICMSRVFIWNPFSFLMDPFYLLKAITYCLLASWVTSKATANRIDLDRNFLETCFFKISQILTEGRF